MYKIFPQGKPGFPPNQRPEMCPRSCTTTRSEKYQGLYKTIKGKRNTLRVLTVGDGDFSFSLSIARGNASSKSTLEMVASSHESNDSVLQTYSSPEILQELKNLGVTVLHNVDATNLSLEPALMDHKTSDKQFDYILWNFPCISATSRAADGQVQEIEDNKSLLRHFFTNAQAYLRPAGEIHVTHKTIEPFSWWGVPVLGIESGLQFLGEVVFDRCLYPGYVNRKVKHSKSFPCADARTFVFRSGGADAMTDSNPAAQSEHGLLPLHEEKLADMLLLALGEQKKLNSSVARITGKRKR